MFGLIIQTEGDIMCTAVSFNKNDHYFGRSLDYERYFGDVVAIAPRNFMFDFRFAGIMREHYAMIGMAHVAENVPLYYDCVNEKGLAMAGLNFVGNAFSESLWRAGMLSRRTSLFRLFSGSAAIFPRRGNYWKTFALSTSHSAANFRQLICTG